MEKIIRVTGEGLVNVKPDTIEVGLLLEALNKNYGKSLKEVDDKVFVLREEMKKLGIEEVKTQSFSIRPRINTYYKNNNKREEVFEGYATSHDIVIRFPFDTKKLGEVVGAISKNILEPRLSINFLAKDTEVAKKNALKDAVTKAKVDAEVLAEAAGVKLDEILSINHSFGEVRVSRPRKAEFMSKEATYCEEASIGSSLGGVNVVDIKITANVTIEWKID